MKFDCVIMNPPYGDDLHLDILNKALDLKNKKGIVINLSPARWLMDPAYKHKPTSDRNVYSRIDNEINKIEILDAEETNKAFGIWMCDLAIYQFDNSKTHTKVAMPLLESIVYKVVREDNFSKHYNDSHDGIYVPVAHNSIASLKNNKFTYFFKEDGVYAKSGWTKDIKNCYHLFHFKNEEDAENFKKFLNTTVMRNFHKICWHSQRRINYKLLPWIDFNKYHTDEALCELFGFDVDERSFMLSDPDSYEIKDYIKYVEV